MAYDFAIIGAGIVGLTLAREIRRRQPGARICIIEKEAREGLHASGRNSGVLYAGFYYTADSLKARFTRDGNRLMKEFCREKGIAVNECGKLVVAKNAADLAGLEELKRRGDLNGVDLRWVNDAEVAKLEPNARTVDRALYSPTTASVDPAVVCALLAEELTAKGIDLPFRRVFEGYAKGKLQTGAGAIEADTLINCAGLYADKVAKSFGIGHEYVLLPFKGIYLHWSGGAPPVKMHVYPVPDLNNPFLGVHFTVAADGHTKIGPTAIPAFWRENYSGASRFKLLELFQVLGHEAGLFFGNSFGFRDLALSEVRKYRKGNMVRSAAELVRELPSRGWEWGRPGIRAQLMNRQTRKLEQDFIVEVGENSLHVLNAVSPGFTCAFPMAGYLCERLGV